MARKKAEVSETTSEEIVEVETPMEDSSVEVIEVKSQDISNEKIYTNDVKSINTFDLVAELSFAQSQIEHCEDYLNVQGADYKGYMRGKIKEWRLYKYKLRQYSIGNVVTLPVRPEAVKDY